MASTFLLFRAADRRLMLALAVLVPVYVVAFFTGNLPFRAVSGTALLLVIAWLVVWTWGRFLAEEKTIPKLAVTLAITSFAYGAVIGVLIQVALAMDMTILPGDQIGAHASAMTFGYIVLAAMGLIEWRLRDTQGLPVLGIIQVASLFVGGLVISVALLAGAEQAGGGIYLLTQLVAVVLFVARVWPAALRSAWGSPAPGRHFAVASLWTVLALVLFMYLVSQVIANPDDPNALPLNILLASDHAVYIGVLTNIVIGLLSLLVMGRGAVSSWVAAPRVLGRQPRAGGVHGRADRRHGRGQAHWRAAHGRGSAARPRAAGATPARIGARYQRALTRLAHAVPAPAQTTASLRRFWASQRRARPTIPAPAHELVRVGPNLAVACAPAGIPRESRPTPPLSPNSPGRARRESRRPAPRSSRGR